MDFKMMKKKLHQHFDMYDHSMILTPENPLTVIYQQNYKAHNISLEETRVFVWDQNPTAEFMAKRWKSELEQIFKDCEVSVVTVEETSHNSVTCGD